MLKIDVQYRLVYFPYMHGETKINTIAIKNSMLVDAVDVIVGG